MSEEGRLPRCNVVHRTDRRKTMQMFAAMGEVTVASDRDAWSVQDEGLEITRGSTLAEAVELAELLIIATKAAGGQSNFSAQSDDADELGHRCGPT